MSLSTTLSQSVVSSSSSEAQSTITTSSVLPAPTTNSTAGEGGGGGQSTKTELFLWPPQGGLKQCERVTFAFTKPAGIPLTCGIYVTNTSTYLEQVILSPTIYNPFSSGTFSWLVDMPIGLSVNVQIFVTINGQVQQYTLPTLIVLEGSDNSCFGRNIGQNTQSIISYASSLNESYIYTAPASSSTKEASEGNDREGISGGAIAGIVVGVILAISLLLLLLFCLIRRRRSMQQHRLEVEQSQFQKNQFQQPQSQTQQNLPHPVTFAQNYAQSVMSGGGGSSGINHLGNHQGGHSFRQSKPPGTIAEPMSTTPPPPQSDYVSPGSPRSPGIVAGGGVEMVGGETNSGIRGLADPNSFVSRS
ncbi:hypothetical protein JCM3765_007056 [Sporobolomyces pararoseus]